MKNHLLTMLAFAPLLMAFQCDEDLSNNSLTLNEFKVTITPQANYSLNDTIWVSGRVSSMAYSGAKGDSIFFDDYNPGDRLSVMKLKNPDDSRNSIDAIDRFELVSAIGTADFGGLCPNADLRPISELDATKEHYTYKLGLLPLEPGSYVLSWDNATIITNTDYHGSILENFEIDGYPNELRFNKCGNYSARLGVNELKLDYFFNVK